MILFANHIKCQVSFFTVQASHMITTAHSWSQSFVSSRFILHQRIVFNSHYKFKPPCLPLETQYRLHLNFLSLYPLSCSVVHLKSSELWGSTTGRRNHLPVPSLCLTCSSSGRLGELIMTPWMIQEGCGPAMRTKFGGWLILLLTGKLKTLLSKPIKTLSQILNPILSLQTQLEMPNGKTVSVLVRVSLSVYCNLFIVCLLWFVIHNK